MNAAAVKQIFDNYSLGDVKVFLDFAELEVIAPKNKRKGTYRLWILEGDADNDLICDINTLQFINGGVEFEVHGGRYELTFYKKFIPTDIK